MLFRRLAKSITEQNWFTVGVELIILVIGVFLGIKVANWNDESNDAVREEKALVAILADLQRDERSLTNSIDMSQINIETSNYLLERAGFAPITKLELPVANSAMFEEPSIPVEGSDDPIPANSRDLWKKATLHYYATQNDAALSALITSGDLDLIKDPTLLVELQSYSAQWYSVKNANNTTFRSFRDQTVFVGQKFGLSPFIEIDDTELIDLMRNEPELLGAVRTLLEFTVLQKQSLETVREATVDLIETIEAQVN
ncbi:MAG: hypothetical protein AAFQ16_05680 [Pseudomonadota bacterium]